MKTPPQQATGYQKEDDPEPARSKLRGIAPKEIEYHKTPLLYEFDIPEFSVRCFESVTTRVSAWRLMKVHTIQEVRSLRRTNDVLS